MPALRFNRASGNDRTQPILDKKIDAIQDEIVRLVEQLGRLSTAKFLGMQTVNIVSAARPQGEVIAHGLPYRPSEEAVLIGPPGVVPNSGGSIGGAVYMPLKPDGKYIYLAGSAGVSYVALWVIT